MRRPNIIHRILVVAVVFLQASLAAQTQHPTHATTSNQDQIKLGTDLVSFNITATDQHGRALSNLKKEDIKIYEDGLEQKMDFFSSDEAPVSWGIVLDRSGSMVTMISDVYQAALHVIDEGTPQDETFIVTFNNKIEMISDFTTDQHALQSSLLGVRAGGETALWDAVAMALDHIKQGKHQKKVLVVLTDGEDNHSRTKLRELVRQAEESNVMIYTIGMFDDMWMVQSGLPLASRVDLEKLSEATGGSAHFPTNLNECQDAMRAIGLEISHQYGIGYYPSNTVRDGRWRKLKVVVSNGKSKQSTVRARPGYYAPKAEEQP